MSIKSLKHSLSSLKLAKKATSTLFNDEIFSSLVSRYLDSETPNNSFINSSINTSSNAIFYNTIYQLLKNKNLSNEELKAISLKFKKILTLELQKNTTLRILKGENANHLSNFGGTYDIFPTEFFCNNCRKNFSVKMIDNETNALNINLFPTVTTLWSQKKLLNNFYTIGELINNPFQPEDNNRAEFFKSLNLIIIYNGNHSSNVALYENNNHIENFNTYDISHWFQEIYYDPKTNTLNHLTCGKTLEPHPLFHENLGYIYEISRLLFQNQIS
ncbi:DUF6710 family protein [Streptococcus porcinus]|uniref:Uncharacterized protein n=1 Tax=Streptococcus porcinus TaxID=1340 RepID=A0A7V9WSG2_STRPO|nr:DUF6710 family protein [Streptococcus porcinus]MBA2796230.1 hypothetical protein [Streptococcus porcinus]